MNFCKTLAVLVLVYGSEVCAVKEGDMTRIKAAEIKSLRRSRDVQ
jgi:hypothetical protein